MKLELPAALMGSSELELMPLTEYPYLKELLPGAAVYVRGLLGQQIYIGPSTSKRSRTVVSGNWSRVQVKVLDVGVKEYPAQQVYLVLRNVKANF